jgi:hypothetical protein
MNNRHRVPESVAVGLTALAIWLVMAAPFHAAKTDITIDFDPKFSFAGLRTWAWHPDGAGDVKLAVADADPKRWAARLDPLIIPAIERELAAQKFTRTAQGADLHVHYYVLATVEQSRQTAGQFLPATPQWGVPPFIASTSALSIYPVGTLIIDITSVAKQAIVWRGTAAREIDWDRTDEQRHKVLDQAIKDLLKKFPPKQK